MEVSDYYGLVLFLARKRHGHLCRCGVHVEVDDLVQEGFMGLLDAARRFDPDRGVAFSTFAYPRIAGAIDDYLRRLDDFPSAQRLRVRNLEVARARLSQQLSREPDESELAEAAGISAQEVSWLASRDRPGQGQGRLEVEAGDAGDGAERAELAQAVQDCLQRALDAQERRVLVLRTGEELTLQVVSQIVGRPLQTVYNVELRARRKVRMCLERKGWDLTDVG